MLGLELTDDEIELVAEARERPETVKYTMITVYEADSAGRKAKAEAEAPKAKPKPVFSDEPEDDEEEVAVAPTKRKRPVDTDGTLDEVPTKSKLQSVISAWGDDD